MFLWVHEIFNIFQLSEKLGNESPRFSPTKKILINKFMGLFNPNMPKLCCILCCSVENRLTKGHDKVIIIWPAPIYCHNNCKLMYLIHFGCLLVQNSWSTCWTKRLQGISWYQWILMFLLIPMVNLWGHFQAWINNRTSRMHLACKIRVDRNPIVFQGVIGCDIKVTWAYI